MKLISDETKKAFIHTQKVSYGDIKVTETDVDIDGLLQAQLKADMESQPKPELPLLMDEVIKSHCHKISTASEGFEFTEEDGTLLGQYTFVDVKKLLETQRDADLKAIGTSVNWQEKPDKAGWWWVMWEDCTTAIREVEKQKDGRLTAYGDGNDYELNSPAYDSAKWLFIPKPTPPTAKKER